MKEKKIPLRKCVITHEKFPKKELLRVVRTPEGEVKIDLSGKLNGHGAYIKKDKEVVLKAMKTKSLDKYLETTISEDVYQDILNSLEV